jgi:hypothetical protein
MKMTELNIHQYAIVSSTLSVEFSFLSLVEDWSAQLAVCLSYAMLVRLLLFLPVMYAVNFVAVGAGGSFLRSDDGLVWSGAPTSSNWNGVALAQGGVVGWVAVGSGASGSTTHSIDGQHFCFFCFFFFNPNKI